MLIVSMNDPVQAPPVVNPAPAETVSGREPGKSARCALPAHLACEARAGGARAGLVDAGELALARRAGMSREVQRVWLIDKRGHAS